jgi:ABC-type transporter Mla MlaB component
MTTNNLIGYDPLAWMDGETIEDVPVAPVKKVRAKTKSQAAPVIEKIENVAESIEETPEELPVVLEKTDEIVDEEVEIDVSIDENGEIEITIDANENIAIEIDVASENAESQTENAVLDALVEEISEQTEKAQTESDAMPEETVIEEEIIDAFIEPLVELGSEASLKTIAELHETFKKVLVAHDTIEINASDVTTIDTATFQMLVSLKKDAPNLGKTINIIYPSARFIESAKLLGLLTVLEVSE